MDILMQSPLESFQPILSAFRGRRFALVALLFLLGCSSAPPSTTTKLTIHEAASRGDVAAVREALAEGVDPNLIKEGQTPLQSTQSVEVAAVLIDAGADVNRPVASGRYAGLTPLHLASTPEMAKLLIDSGANIEAGNAVGQTPLV